MVVEADCDRDEESFEGVVNQEMSWVSSSSEAGLEGSEVEVDVVEVNLA